MPRYREEVINIRIGDILKEMGFKASAEIISGGKLPDVMVNADGVKINIEGRFGVSPQVKELEERCRERIETGICDIAVGIVYPEQLRSAENDGALIQKIKESDLHSFIVSITSKGVEKMDLGTIKMKDIAEKLNYLYSEVVSTDLLQEQIKKVNSVIEKTSEMAAAHGLFFKGEEVINKLENVLGIKTDKERVKKSIHKDLLKIGLFVMFDGLMFHEVFSGTPEARKKRVQSLRTAPKSNLTSFLEKEWEKIRKVNYLPIFDLASSVCSCLPTSPETDTILKKLIEAVLDVISSGVLLKHDLMGRVYHRLLLKTTGKYYAAYYTGIPAAWILSNLSIKTPNPDLKWHFEDLGALRSLRIIDPACGSGTLLSGIYMALKDKYIFDRYSTDNPKDLNLIRFHKFMLEDVLNGWDILDYAGHLTLTNLALHNPDSAFLSSNIYTLPIGDTSKGNLYLGSLEYLDTTREQRLQFKEYRTLPTKKGLDIEEEKKLSVPKQSMDIVTMNPPFSRSAQPNIKFGFVEEETMRGMNKRLRKLGKDLEYKSIGQAGLGAYFIILADQLLKPGGKLTLVIPRSILSGPSWEEIRKRIFLEGYEIEYIVSNYDPGDKELGIQPWNWSENTNLGEVLIVARKTDKVVKKRYTTFINLWNKPRNELESLKIVSDSIKVRAQEGKKEFLGGEGDYEELELNDKGIGVAYNISQKYLEKSFLIPCLFASPDLNKLAFEIIHNDLLPLIPLGARADKLGVDIKQIHETFKLVSHQTKYSVVWGCPGNLDTIGLKDFQYIAPKEGDAAERIYNERASSFLIAERIWTNSAKLLSMVSPGPILATEFWETSLKDRDEEKILSMWMNSTFGFLIFLASSVSNRQDRFTLKKTQLPDFPVLDISVLSTQAKQDLLGQFEKIKDTPFNSFPQEFNLAFSGKGVRKQIDDIFSKVLDLKLNLKPHYRMLSRDPIISLKRL